MLITKPTRTGDQYLILIDNEEKHIQVYINNYSNLIYAFLLIIVKQPSQIPSVTQGIFESDGGCHFLV